MISNVLVATAPARLEVTVSVAILGMSSSHPARGANPSHWPVLFPARPRSPKIRVSCSSVDAELKQLQAASLVLQKFSANQIFRFLIPHSSKGLRIAGGVFNGLPRDYVVARRRCNLAKAVHSRREGFGSVDCRGYL
jgi:hypothetical protein